MEQKQNYKASGIYLFSGRLGISSYKSVTYASKHSIKRKNFLMARPIRHPGNDATFIRSNKRRISMIEKIWKPTQNFQAYVEINNKSSKPSLYLNEFMINNPVLDSETEERLSVWKAGYFKSTKSASLLSPSENYLSGPKNNENTSTAPINHDYDQSFESNISSTATSTDTAQIPIKGDEAVLYTTVNLSVDLAEKGLEDSLSMDTDKDGDADMKSEAPKEPHVVQDHNENVFDTCTDSKILLADNLDSSESNKSVEKDRIDGLPKQCDVDPNADTIANSNTPAYSKKRKFDSIFLDRPTNTKHAKTWAEDSSITLANTHLPKILEPETGDYEATRTQVENIVLYLEKDLGVFAKLQTNIFGFID